MAQLRPHRSSVQPVVHYCNYFYRCRRPKQNDINILINSALQRTPGIEHDFDGDTHDSTPD